MLLDRVSIKSEAKDIVKNASVSAYLFTLLFLALSWLLAGMSDYVSLNEETVYNIYYATGVDLSFLVLHRAFPALLVTFITILAALLGVLLEIGYILYHLGIRRGREMPYLTLFDGFSFAGKVILLYIVQYIFIFLWSLLFIVPGIIAAYRYRFALYNLYENPGIGVMEALNMSKQQTLGYKGQLFMLDLSYIGWLLLASLTSVVQTGYIYACIFQDPGYYLANPAQVYAITLPMPVGLQVVLGCVWPLLVALFYLPVYQCTELGYFDTAKHTSGVGEGAAPKDPGSFDSGWGGF